MAVPIPYALPSSNQVNIHILRGAETMACVVHHGPYEELPNAYNALLRWVDASGYRVDGPNRDLYFLQTQAQETAPTVWDVPAQTYAVFPCTLETIHETFNNAYQNWLPQSGFKRSDGPDFEFYPPDFDPEAGTGMFVYIPVTK